MKGDSERKGWMGPDWDQAFLGGDFSEARYFC